MTANNTTGPAASSSGEQGRPLSAWSSARRTGGVLMVVAVLLLALNLRPAVTALGVIVPELQESLGLSGATAGILLALPTLCFALTGLIVAPLAQWLGPRGAVVVGLGSLTCGQALRALVGAPWALFAGSILTLAGIAVGNVLLPGLIRRYFPGAIGPMTAAYTTTLMVGQTLGAGITIPVEDALGGTWQLGLGMWVVTAAVALVPWLVAIGGRRSGDRLPVDGDGAIAGGGGDAAVRAASGDAAQAPGAVRVWDLARSRHAWALVFYFGLLAVQAYVVFGWVPRILVDASISESSAGALMALNTVTGIPLAALVPSALGRVRRQGYLIAALCGSLVVGYLGLLTIPGTIPWFHVFMVGIGTGGSFPLCLTLITLRARTLEGTAALSAFGQSLGYVMATVGPIGFGVLYDLFDGPTVPLIVLTATVVPMFVTGLVVVRAWTIEDDLTRTARH